MKKKLLSLLLIPLALALTIGTSFAVPTAPVLSYEINGFNIAISWTEDPGATSYTLYYAPYPYAGAETIASAPMGGATSFAVDLWENAAYYIAVTASDASGESPYSNVEYFVMTPAAPDAPVLSSGTDGLNISLSWTEVPEATGYKLYYSSEEAPETFSGLDVGDETNVSYYLWEGAAYYLKVTSYNASGLESESSNTEYFIMGPPTPEWVDDDGDGFTEYQGDCDDSDQDINPAAEDICEDGIDQDCSGGDEVCEVPAVEEPTFDPAPGEFTSTQRITLTSATADATIYYTTDGSTPSTDSTLYTSPLTLSITQTIRAIAVKEGVGVSAIASGVYTFSIRVSTPTLSLDSGIYDDAQSLTLTVFTPGATIYYTTDGTMPTGASNLYTTPLTVSTSQTVKAVAVKDGMANSIVASGTYTITYQAFAPTLSPEPGIYYYPQNVSLSSATDGASLHYTTDGTTATTGSTLYSSPLEVSTSQTINAIAARAGLATSVLSSGTYTIRTVAGVWALRMVTGANSCGQTVGEETDLGNVTVTQSGQNITVASPYGTETGTIAGDTLSWSMSSPIDQGEISGTLNFSMMLTLSGDGNSFSGPVDFTFTGDPLSCSGQATVYGTRVP